MLPKILKNFNAFVDGRGYAGRIDEISLPKLFIKTEEYRAGGMDIPVAIDMGMEKLEAELTFSEYDPELFRLFGLVDGNAVSLTLRGGLQGSGDAEAVVVNLRGQFKEFDPGNWKPADKATLKYTVSIRYYKLTIDRRELIEINTNGRLRRDMPRRTNVQQLTEEDFDENILNYNTTPRKSLGWKTPLEIFNKNLARVALQT